MKFSHSENYIRRYALSRLGTFDDGPRIADPRTDMRHAVQRVESIEGFDSARIRLLLHRAELRVVASRRPRISFASVWDGWRLSGIFLEQQPPIALYLCEPRRGRHLRRKKGASGQMSQMSTMSSLTPPLAFDIPRHFGLKIISPSQSRRDTSGLILLCMGPSSRILLVGLHLLHPSFLVSNPCSTSERKCTQELFD